VGGGASFQIQASLVFYLSATRASNVNYRIPCEFWQTRQIRRAGISSALQKKSRLNDDGKAHVSAKAAVGLLKIPPSAQIS